MLKKRTEICLAIWAGLFGGERLKGEMALTIAVSESQRNEKEKAWVSLYMVEYRNPRVGGERYVDTCLTVERPRCLTEYCRVKAR